MEIIEKKETPSGFKWSLQAAKKAKTANKFIWVGDDRTYFKSISCAIELWISDDIDESSSIFNIKYRIAGIPSDIATSLIYNGYTNDEIKNILNDSITKNNYNSNKKNEYLKELSSCRKTMLIIEKKKTVSKFKYSLEETIKAKDNNTFLKVCDNGMIDNYRPLSKALKLWNTDEQNEIFNLQYRITGTPLNITNMLKSYGISDIEIEYVMNNSITKNNYNSDKKTDYLEELKRHRQFKSREGRLIIKENEELSSQIIKWSIEKFEISKAENKFIYINGDIVLYLTLSDIVKFWTNDDECDLILNTKFRIIATPRDITILFQYFSYSVPQINKLIKSSIDKYNFINMIKI